MDNIYLTKKKLIINCSQILRRNAFIWRQTFWLLCSTLLWFEYLVLLRQQSYLYYHCWENLLIVINKIQSRLFKGHPIQFIIIIITIPQYLEKVKIPLPSPAGLFIELSFLKKRVNLNPAKSQQKCDFLKSNLLFAIKYQLNKHYTKQCSRIILTW